LSFFSPFTFQDLRFGQVIGVSKIRAGHFAEKLHCSLPSLRSSRCAILAFLPEEPAAIRLAKRTATNAVSWSEALRLTCALKP